MARAGGESDKIGNTYEGAWTIHYMLLVLAGRAKAITVEDIGEKAEGSEFTLTSLHHGDEAHQVKRKQRNAQGWSLQQLRNKDVLEAARHQVQQGRQFHFVSKIPAPKLDELSDRARRSANVESFLADWLTEGLRGDFSSLSEEYGSDQVAWQTLRETWFHCQDEVGLRRVNDALAELLLTGAPATAAWLSLGDLANQNLGVRLTAAAIEERLPEYELSRAQLIGDPTVVQAVDEVLASWKASIELTFLRPAIARAESTDLADRLRSSDTPVTIVVGAAGAGKSGVLWQS